MTGPAETSASDPVPIRQRPIPDQLDWHIEKLAPLIDSRRLDREAVIAVGAAIVGMGAIVAQLRKHAADEHSRLSQDLDREADLKNRAETAKQELAKLRKAAPSGPHHPDDAAVAEVRAWLPEGTPDHALIELEAHTLRGVLAVLDQWEQNARTAAAQRNAAEGALEAAKVDLRLLREDVGDANKRADADCSTAIERADEAEHVLTQLRGVLGQPTTEYGHQVHGDDGWIGDAVSQSSENAARAAVDHINALRGTSRAKLVVHEVWHAETEWRVVEDD